MTSFGGVLARYNRSFGGFHISAEFKNCISCAQPGWNGHINFNTPELRQRLIDHYIVPCTDHLKALAPTLPIGIPPSFFDKNSFLGKVNGTWMGAEQWGEWMVAFLTAVPNLDRFTYQDCVGSSLYSYPYADTVRYFKALRAAVDEANKQRAQVVGGDVFGRVMPCQLNVVMTVMMARTTLRQHNSVVRRCRQAAYECHRGRANMHHITASCYVQTHPM